MEISSRRIEIRKEEDEPRIPGDWRLVELKRIVAEKEARLDSVIAEQRAGESRD